MENNLSYYKIFYTVACTGNISKAAKALYISQPAISKAINKLEQNLKTILFTRNSRGVSLTFEGELLFEQCKIAFHALSNGETQVKNATELNMGHLRIGVSTTLCKHMLLPYLKRFILKYPNIRLTIACEATHAISNLLDRGDIDIGLVAKPASLKGMHYYSLGEIHDVFAASPHYLNRLNREQGEELTSEQLPDVASFMLLDKGNVTRQHVDFYLSEHNLILSNPLEVTSMDLLIDFAKIGLGIGCVIKEFIKTELTSGALVEIKLPFSISEREIGFLCNDTQVKPKAVTYFLDMMR